MGFLDFLSKPASPSVLRLPSGSFTVDPNGKVITSTLPASFPSEHVKQIAHVILAVFQGAQKAQMPLTEMSINYAALKLSARELRGGAIIFVSPRSLTTK